MSIHNGALLPTLLGIPPVTILLMLPPTYSIILTLISYLILTMRRIRFGDMFVTTPPTPPNSHQNDFNRLGFSFATPLKHQWSTVGGWNYNFSHKYSQSFFLWITI